MKEFHNGMLKIYQGVIAEKFPRNFGYTVNASQREHELLEAQRL